MKKIVLPIVVLALSWSFTYSQSLTLKECVDIALKNNLTVRRSLYNVKSSEINFLQAKGNFLPTASVRGNFLQNYGRTLNPLTYSYVNTMTQTIGPGLSASMPLFNAGKIRSTYRQNKKSVEAADLDYEKTKNDVIITVVTNYTNVILNKELLENSKFQLNSSQQQLERIQKQVAAGALPKSNELTQEATVATNETNVITQENAYNLSLLQLKQSMQVLASDSLDIVIPDIALEDMTITQTPKEIYDVSVKTLPQVKSAMLKVQAAEYAVTAARGNYYPTVSLIAGANSNYSSASDNRKVYVNDLTTYNKVPLGSVVDVNNQPVYQYSPSANTPYSIAKYGVASQVNDYLTKYVGFSLNIPIANGFQTRTNVKQQVVNKELAEIGVKETENALRQSIETAYNNAIAAAKTYTAAVKQVNANEEAFRMVQQRHQIGAATYIEYQVASNDLYSAKSGLARAKYNFILTKKILEFYQGKSIEY